MPQTEMRRIRDATLSLLADAIRGREPRMHPRLSSRAWETLVGRAEACEILGMLYPAVAALPGDSAPPDALMSRWRKAAMQTGMRETRRYLAATAVMRALADRDVRALGLKGIVVRAFYAEADLRTMGDIDLLIRPGDLPAAEDALRRMRMHPIPDDNNVSTWIAPSGLTVELHTALFLSPFPFPGTHELMESFFAHAAEAAAGGPAWPEPSAEDSAVYLVLHMAKHLRGGGFGPRDVTDLVLTMERGVDAKRLVARLETHGVGVLGRAVLMLAREHLGLKVEDAALEGRVIPPDLVSRLADDILDAGVHGSGSPERGLAVEAMRMERSILGGDALPSQRPAAEGWRLLVWMLFPRRTELKARYAYARRNAWMLPAAWVHRWLHTGLQQPREAIRRLVGTFQIGSLRDRQRALLAELGLLD